MRISKKTEYAVHSVLYVAYHRDRTVLLDELAEQGISREYLAKVMRLLTKADVLKSSVGVGGGYVLGRDADCITLKDIFDAVEGENFYSCESDARMCALGGRCGITDVFSAAREKFMGELAKYTVADVLAEHGRSINWFNAV